MARTAALPTMPCNTPRTAHLTAATAPMTDTFATPSLGQRNGSAGAMIARQAIVNARQAVVGYELLDRSHARNDHTAASDVLALMRRVQSRVADATGIQLVPEVQFAGEWGDLLNGMETVS